MKLVVIFFIGKTRAFDGAVESSQNWPDLYLVIKLNKLNSFNCSSLVKPFPHLY